MDMMREMRISARGLLRAPGFAVVAVATLALGIGANALIFGVVDSVVLRPLPYPEAGRLVRIWDRSFMGLADYALVNENVTSLEATSAWRSGVGLNFETGGEPLRLTGSEVTADFMTVLGTRPQIGPGFSPEAGAPGARKEVILGNGLWQDVFGADPAVIGRTVQSNGVGYTVVGVLDAAHDFPTSGDQFLLPITVDWSDTNLMWGGGGYRALGRLASGRSTTDAQREISQIHDNVISPSNPYWTPAPGIRERATVVDLHTSIVGNVRSRMLILLGAVGLVLLVVSANVANLLLSRGSPDVRTRLFARRWVRAARDWSGLALRRVFCWRLRAPLWVS